MGRHGLSARSLICMPAPRGYATASEAADQPTVFPLKELDRGKNLGLLYEHLEMSYLKEIVLAAAAMLAGGCRTAEVREARVRDSEITIACNYFGQTRASL